MDVGVREHVGLDQVDDEAVDHRANGLHHVVSEGAAVPLVCVQDPMPGSKPCVCRTIVASVSRIA